MRVSTLTKTMTERARALREQAEYLRSPHRKNGPSMCEAEASAKQLTDEADRLDCDAFYLPLVPDS